MKRNIAIDETSESKNSFVVCYRITIENENEIDIGKEKNLRDPQI